MDRETKACGASLKSMSIFLIVLESIGTVLLGVFLLSNIFAADKWLSVIINSCFFTLSLASVISFSLSIKGGSPLMVVPMMANQVVSIIWLAVWLYACISAVTSGYLWSLEWLGGPKSDRSVVSKDITDVNYRDPNETSPEAKKAIRFGLMITVAVLFMFVVKLFVFSIAKSAFVSLQKAAAGEAERKREKEGQYEMEERFIEDRDARSSRFDRYDKESSRSSRQLSKKSSQEEEWSRSSGREEWREQTGRNNDYPQQKHSIIGPQESCC